MSQSEGLRKKGICVGCADFKPIKAKKMCQNCWHKFKRKNNPEFFLRTRYTELRQRCINQRNNNGYYFGLDHCSRSEFLNRFRNDETFNDLFNVWKQSGWDIKLCPSVDRIDVNKGYTLDNIQFITHSDNCAKDQIKQTVHVYSEDKQTLLYVFESQSEAARHLNIPQANIWKVITGERNHAGGFVFVGGDYHA